MIDDCLLKQDARNKKLEARDELHVTRFEL